MGRPTAYIKVFLAGPSSFLFYEKHVDYLLGVALLRCAIERTGMGAEIQQTFRGRLQ
jgi:hypothetical protein